MNTPGAPSPLPSQQTPSQAGPQGESSSAQDATGRTAGGPLLEMFTPTPAERRSLPVAAIAIGAAALIAIPAGLYLTLHRPPATRAGQVRSADPYAASLALTGLALSESTSLSGGKQTYLDGHIRNQGSRTVTAATAQVFFANDESMPPQVETVPISLVRTHEPYLDTQPIADAPLAPGEEREFRLIFESIGTNWNGQMPKVSIVSVSSR